MLRRFAPRSQSTERFDVAFYAPWIGPLLAPGSDPPTGGAETQILMLARALTDRGLRVCLVSLEAGKPLPEEVDGVRVVTQRRRHTHVRGVRMLAWLMSLVRVLGRLDAEAFVQRAATSTTGLVSLIAKAKRRRFVYSSSSVIDFDYGLLERNRRAVWVFHLGVKLADAVVVQTPEQVELCRQRFERTPAMIKSIAESAPRRTAEPRAFLWVGRLAHYKRPEAYVKLARAFPEAAFWMIAAPSGGFGLELAPELERAAAQLPNLELLEPKPRDELGLLIESAVAMVNTSDYEGMPNTFLEGWARGVPALALTHDPDGVIEREGLGGFAHGSPERLAELARRMWNTRRDQSAMAERCRAYIAREHAPNAVVDRWLEVFRGLRGDGTPAKAHGG